MAYDPSKDIEELTRKAKSGTVSPQDVYDVIKGGQTFYKATYGDVNRYLGDTRDYIVEGGAYTDGGAEQIRRTYADYAKRDQAHTAAELAGENSGNLSSYAAAQANRTARDMLTAGEQAVAQRAEQIHEDLLESDRLLADTAATVQDRLQGGIDSAVDLAKLSSDERKSALSNLLDYYGILQK